MKHTLCGILSVAMVCFSQPTDDIAITNNYSIRPSVCFFLCFCVLQGAEFVAFVSVNDVYVMRAWEEAQGAKGKVLMLSDGNGDLAASVRSPPMNLNKKCRTCL